MPPPPQRPVIVLADDLIWGTRLAATIDALPGFTASAVRNLADFEARIGRAGDPAIVDLTARAYDGIAAIEVAVDRGSRVLAVGQHDDLELRRRALAAGADRVFAYRKLFEDGPTTLALWLGLTVERAR